MWIVTAKYGIFNTDAISRITENMFGTYALCGGATLPISEKPVRNTIVDALRRGDNFVEVE